jgi:hypothetical protein
MGGPGSGRWYRWQGSKDTAEGYRFLDVRLLHRRGVLRPGGWDLVTWSRAGGSPRARSPCGVARTA